MFEDTSLWMMLGSMASTAGLLGVWFDRTVSRPDSDSDSDSDGWLYSHLD